MSELYQKLGHWALVDIAIIALIIYRLLLLIRGTRAMQMVLGILMTVGFAFFISQVYPLTTLKWLMDKFYSSIIIIIVILFQEDIRRVLSRMGKKTVFQNQEQASSRQALDEIVRAASSLAARKVGALIVVERHIILSRYVDIGILIDARISKELLLSVFHPTSPIHDGAVIVQQGRIAAAGCFLPLTKDEDVDTNFGTRHRAALGISQDTDAIAIAISEETSTVSVMIDGHILRNLDAKDLRKTLRRLISGGDLDDSNEHTKQVKLGFWEKFRMIKPRGKS